MAKIVTTVDDWSLYMDSKSVPANETVRFSLDGKNYTTDLTTEHATTLRETLSAWIEAAVAANGAPKRSTPVKNKTWYAGAGPERKAIRDSIRIWGIAHGWDSTTLPR